MAVQLLFPSGSGPGSTQGDALDPIDDDRVEGGEFVTLSASVISGTGSFVVNGDSADVNILDDDRENFNCTIKYRVLKLIALNLPIITCRANCWVSTRLVRSE